MVVSISFMNALESFRYEGRVLTNAWLEPCVYKFGYGFCDTVAAGYDRSDSHWILRIFFLESTFWMCVGLWVVYKIQTLLVS